MKKYMWAAILFLFTAMPLSFARALSLIPCEGTPESPCGFNELILMINTLITAVLTYFVLPIATVVLLYGGFLYLTSGGNANKRTKANSMFRKLLIGLFFCLTAWAIVKLILTVFGYHDTTFSPVAGTLLLYT